VWGGERGILLGSSLPPGSVQGKKSPVSACAGRGEGRLVAGIGERPDQKGTRKWEGGKNAYSGRGGGDP